MLLIKISHLKERGDGGYQMKSLSSLCTPTTTTTNRVLISPIYLSTT